MVGHPVGRSKPHLPPISNLPETLVVQRSDITAYCLNPFSFNIIHDPATMRILDAKVQEFGERFGPADHVDEPPMCWAMVNIDNRWHRTHLLEKYYTADAECYGAEVCLIDSGRRERLNIDRIFPMPPEVLTAAPAQSLRIFPKDIQRPTAPSICELFEYCLEARFRLTFDDFSTSGEQRPYLAGIVAEVEVGHEEWISLRQLLLLPTVRDGGNTNGGTRTTSEIHSNDNASARLNHTTANGQPLATPPQNDIAGPREDDEESDAVSSDEESCTDSPDQERENRITYKPSATGDPVDLEGENLGIVMTRKTLENARKTERRNVFRSRPCFRFRSSEGCRLGNLCPHPHENLEESTQAAAGTTFEFRDYPDIKDLKKNFTAFGVCTHVDEKGFIYLVLPYGVADIWTVLELRGNLDLEFREIRYELSRRYDHQLEKKRTHFNPIDNLAVVWVEKSGSGALHNVPQGWYRARVRQREGKHCEVFLVDHGAILRTSMENLFPLEDDLCDRKQQTIRCQITGTELSTEPGKASEIYEALRNRILTFKVYKHEEKFDVYQVQMFSVSESKAIHHGEDLIRRNILKSIQPVD